MNNIDHKIKELFANVQSRKNEIGKIEIEPKWKTTCSIKVDFRETPINIQTVNINDLHKTVCFILNNKNNIAEANQILNMNIDSYQGFSVDDWLSDCIKRSKIIEIKQKRDELENLEKRLNGIISPEQRREMELESIIKILG